MKRKWSVSCRVGWTFAHLINYRYRASHWTHITHTHSCLQDWWHSAIRPRLHFWLIVFSQSFVLCSSIHPSSAMQVATSFSYSSTAARLIMARMFSFALPRDIFIFSFISLFFHLPFSAVCRAHRIAYALLDFSPLLPHPFNKLYFSKHVALNNCAASKHFWHLPQLFATAWRLRLNSSVNALKSDEFHAQNELLLRFSEHPTPN